MIFLATLVVVVPVVVMYVLPALGMLISGVSYLFCYGLDVLFSAGVCPQAPWLMWVVWGGVIGAAFGFWTVAPRYGLREKRTLVLLLPFPLMLLVALVALIISH